jgi:ABC-type transport system involved in cytochrome c biogenesis permease subunit
MRAAIESMVAENPNPAIGPLATMLDAWRAGDEVGFNSALAGYQSILAGRPPAESSTLDFEVFFNHLEPFYHCSVLYVLAFLLSAFAWMGWSGPLNRTATWLILLTLVVHTFALGARVYISGYPPITNLYGTAVFIGWACVILGLIIEAVYRIGIGNLVASVAGFATLLIAHFLAGDGDTLEMMQAVLDTKFWLATHVVVINLGYSATLFAGGLGVLFILRGVLGSSLDKDLEKTFGRMIYGVLCFALLMSFVGTVLGGLWADDSWGRFWGWDPKENGALLIVLWDALVLHARWGGMIKTRGIAVMAVFGGIVTGWSWFGVNQLGVGLHSYGFTDSVAFWLLVFVASQLGAMGMGMLPRSWWRSARVPGKRLIKALNGG